MAIGIALEHVMLIVNAIEQHGFNRQLWDNLGAKPLAVKGARPISLKTKARIRSDSKSIEQQGFICEFLGKLGC
ncbi:MAG: hypothetical protein JO327_08885 [Nitrososphaeraceae archaeon]|nr:hypothetical protein [Nitrososphaeraceae archaeon]